jgi:hypothetical protein
MPPPAIYNDRSLITLEILNIHGQGGYIILLMFFTQNTQGCFAVHTSHKIHAY